jgi:Na+/H+ antiporter NhaA
MQRRFLHSFMRFLRAEALGGLVLLLMTLVALGVANSRHGGHFAQLWQRHVGVRGLELSLHDWVNDGLMSLFFLRVGLEIKREVLIGELASLRRCQSSRRLAAWRRPRFYIWASDGFWVARWWRAAGRFRRPPTSRLLSG